MAFKFFAPQRKIFKIVTDSAYAYDASVSRAVLVLLLRHGTQQARHYPARGTGRPDVSGHCRRSCEFRDVEEDSGGLVIARLPLFFEYSEMKGRIDPDTVL